MMDYFYGAQADMFAFYRIPKVLFTDKRFQSVSAEAKILYGILLDRMSLSQKNGWIDSAGRVFIVFTMEEVMETMGCADRKATRLMNDLETNAGLIERKRQGLGRPNIIYVKNFADATAEQALESKESRILNRENAASAAVKTTVQGASKQRTNNTDMNKTDKSETDIYPILSVRTEHDGRENEDGMGSDGMNREKIRCFIENNLEYDVLLENNPYSREEIAEMVDLIVDTVCSKRKTIRIAGDDKPREVVRDQFLKLKAEHIEYVLEALQDHPTEIRNIKQYLLAALYNATMTIENGVSALVRRRSGSGGLPEPQW